MILLPIAEYIIRVLIFVHGHKAILGIVEKNAPLQKTEQNDPTPTQATNPNDSGHYGGL